MGTLYVVATPIGNLKDITLRALDVLKNVDFIIAEDTRVTLKILSHYQIKKSVISYHEHSDSKKISQIISLLKSGKNLALVSDAGTPNISDPGAYLIEKIVEQVPEIVIQPIPGACAAISALSISSVRGDKFVFLGFLPKNKTKVKKLLSSFKNIDIPIIIYESPYRLIKTLSILREFFGDKNILLAKEITKVFEKAYRGKISEVISEIEADKIRGEYVIVL
jgi:16S rRNA (cytidine1402-2'-O)-methyltransferase